MRSASPGIPLPSRHQVGRYTALVGAAAFVLLTTWTGAGSARADEGSVVASGPDWTVTNTSEGYRVDLRLAEPLAVRSAQASLQVDGVDLGDVAVSADELTVSVLTTDPAVAGAGEVDLAWDGVPDDQQDVVVPGAADPAPQLSGQVLDEDPARIGPYRVGRADYDLGNEVEDLAGIPGHKGEMRGAIYYPVEAQRPAPVVIFLHGRHSACVAPQDDWPCPTRGDIPSYLGYDDPARALASNGVAVVSISANAINDLDSLSSDSGTDARAHLVLDTLDRLSAANSDAGSPGFDPQLKGRLELYEVGLMGHSRGGEGVVRAAQLNLQRDRPYGIESVLTLAPTNFARLTVPGVITSTVLPYCDGDVDDLSGQHYIDDSRYGEVDSVLRSSILVMGANHNFFNTIWSPGGFAVKTADDWSFVDRDQANPTCGADAPGRLSQVEQRAVGTAYLSGFFRLTVGNQRQFLPMFDGDGARVASTGRADIRVTSTAPAVVRSEVARFTDDLSGGSAGGLTAEICTGAPPAVSPVRPACSTLQEEQLPHFSASPEAPTVPTSSMAHVRWPGPGGVLRIPVDPEEHDVEQYQNLSFAVAPDDSVVGSTTMGVQVVDNQGRVSTIDPARLTSALQVLPGSGWPLRRVMLRQVSIPVAALTGIDLTDLAEIRFLSGDQPGGVYLSDLAFTLPSPGIASQPALPSVSLHPTAVQQESATTTAHVAVRLSRVVDEPVTAWLTTRVQGRSDFTASRPITIPAGRRCLALDVDIPGSQDPGVLTEALTAQLTSTRRALPAQDATLLQVRAGIFPGDEAPATIPEVGVQGDVCQEAVAAFGSLQITSPTAAGSTATIRAGGYRPGESVALIAFPEQTAVLRQVSRPDGTVEFSVPIAGSRTPGTYQVSASGAGSGRIDLGTLVVTAAAPATQPNPTPDASTDPTPTGATTTTPGPSTTSPPVASTDAAANPMATVSVTVTATALEVTDSAGPPPQIRRAGDRDPATSTPAGDAVLAATGVHLADWLATAAALLVVGVVLTVAARRTRSSAR